MVEIRNAKFDDIFSIVKLIENSKAVNAKNLVLSIASHIDKNDSLARVLTNDGIICGVWLSKEYKKHISLSFFYVNEFFRKKMFTFKFFVSCFKKINQEKHLYISSSDISDFERYVIPVEGQKDVYRFKGLR